MAGRERAPVPVAVDLEEDGEIAPPRPQEVAVERVGEAVGLHGGGRGEQALRRHLPAVEVARPVVGVAPTEQVTVDPLQGRRERSRPRLEVHQPLGRPDPLRPRLDTAPEHLGVPAKVSCVPSSADEGVHAPGQLVRPRLTTRVDQHVALPQAHEPQGGGSPPPPAAPPGVRPHMATFAGTVAGAPWGRVAARAGSPRGRAARRQGRRRHSGNTTP